MHTVYVTLRQVGLNSNKSESFFIIIRERPCIGRKCWLSRSYKKKAVRCYFQKKKVSLLFVSGVDGLLRLVTCFVPGKCMAGNLKGNGVL